MYKRKAFWITSIFGITTIINIATQLIIARFFGVSGSLDAFLLAVTLPTIFMTTMYASVNDMFLPIYTKALQSKAKTAARIAGSWCKQLSLMGSILTVIMVAAPWIVLLLLFGNDGVRGTQHLRIMAPTFLLGLLNAQLMSMAYAKKHFLLPPLLQLVGAGVNAAVVVFFGTSMGIYALSVGFLLNYTVQFILLLPYAQFDLSAPRVETNNLYKSWLPLIGAYILLRSDTWLLRFSSTGLGEGAVSTVNYGARIMSLSAGIITSGIKVLLFPLLSEAAAKKNTVRFNALVVKGQIAAVVLGAIAVIFILLVARPLVETFLVAGAFSSENGRAVLNLLPWFVPAALGWALFEVAAAPFLALGRQKIVASVTGLSFVGSVVSTFILKPQLGILSAPIAVGLLVGVNTLVLGSIWYLFRQQLLKPKKS
ncbi:hypothetical protein COU89_02810 [Candidatus Roizmanbacteria bacterium CG10_big_fil_rev_8_21_14_0_10_45_7]|uniref:Polysaccharide biosynthesis protein C-terminal domain-containing protein n=1 Tax=Candidatus Roizmanbacteria bacterium CG10_big_fil_rev_8_21_14_0_10_45_7 TaxID=1974854 RepID=A0A2M8KUA5_9BACT|nr:MAG: hypothetical protein COU89_02810 [Candidatus Roizmanbacteria bacterium CG10_big_fil_rev_8_21_14_0_10_45_7]